MESEEREAVSNASLPKVQVETSEKLLTTKLKSEVSRYHFCNISPPVLFVANLFFQPFSLVILWGF